MNAERAQHVLMHKRLLSMARNPSIGHAIEVHLMQVSYRRKLLFFFCLIQQLEILGDAS